MKVCVLCFNKNGKFTNHGAERKAVAICFFSLAQWFPALGSLTKYWWLGSPCLSAPENLMSLVWVQPGHRTFKNHPRKKKKITPGTSLVVQWLRIRLPMQGTRVRALVWEDPTCRGATKPVCHSYWARVPQLLKPTRLEPVLRNKRSHRNEKSALSNKE